MDFSQPVSSRGKSMAGMTADTGDQESQLPDGGPQPVLAPTGDHVAAAGLGVTLDGQPLNLAGNPPTSRTSALLIPPMVRITPS